MQQYQEKVDLIRKRLVATQSRQKSYADMRRRPLEFKVGDFVFLKVSPTKGVARFEKRGKLSPRYIGPYQISRSVGEVAYKLELPPELSGVHSIFHVSMLRKCLADVSQVIPVQPEELRENLSMVEDVVQLLDRKDQVLRNKVIPLVLVQWQHYGAEEATWEREANIYSKYPHLFY